MDSDALWRGLSGGGDVAGLGECVFGDGLEVTDKAVDEGDTGCFVAQRAVFTVGVTVGGVTSACFGVAF